MKNTYLRSELKAAASELESFYPKNAKFELTVIHADSDAEKINDSFCLHALKEATNELFKETDATHIVAAVVISKPLADDVKSQHTASFGLTTITSDTKENFLQKTNETFKLLKTKLPLFEGNFLKLEHVAQALGTYASVMRKYPLAGSIQIFSYSGEYYIERAAFISLQGLLYFIEHSQNKLVVAHREELENKIKSRIIATRTN